MSGDSGDIAMLVLLDLSAAFDTIDHAMLLSRLDNDYGLNDTVLEWCSSYLTDRKQFVQINKAMSRSEVLACGVAQGSVLGPILFTMYTRPLGHLISEKHVAHHFYADDRQLRCLLVGISGDQLNTLQRIQNRAARIITRTKLHSHISPALQSLHLLRIRSKGSNRDLTLIPMLDGRQSKMDTHHMSNTKYLIYRCAKSDLCGGWSNRLKGILMGFYISIATPRKDGIDITSLPCNLTSFLTPNSVPWNEARFEVIRDDRPAGVYNEMGKVSLISKSKTLNFTAWLKHDIAYFLVDLDYVESLKVNRVHGKEFSWMENKTRDQVFATAYKTLFSLSASLKEALSRFLSRAKPRGSSKLVCAQIRLFKNPSNPNDNKNRRGATMQDVQKIWNFFRNFSDPSTYKIFATSDSETVMQQARKLFPSQIMESEGKVFHMELGTDRRSRCDGWKKVILDQHVLMSCDVLVFTFSGVAAYVRGTQKGLYCMVEHKLIKCSPSKLRPLFNVYG
ncbi:uncharacterized protein [Haliotis asinina]|uniref:uncharacterized protein n=1 Tax=Haliotis asinina TaxID=109174 RepID=UPI00353277A1